LSSILKALKKIEVQSSRSDSFFAMPERIDKNPERDPGERRRRHIGRLIAIVLILLIVFIAAIILFNQRHFIITKIFPAGVTGKTEQDSSIASAGSNIFRAKIPAVTTGAAQSPSKGTRLAKKQLNASPPDKKTEPSVDHLSESPGASVDQPSPKTPAAARSSRQETASNRKDPLPQKPAPEDTASSRKTVAAKSVPSGKPATRAKKPKKTETYDRLDGSKLRLQALAWFIDPAKRIAVINDRIVREGESVDGYQVAKIRPQDVVVSDGTKSWRLEFGLKQ
jgi:hypothetical protein